jgi:hypothetical protein
MDFAYCPEFWAIGKSINPVILRAQGKMSELYLLKLTVLTLHQST